MALTLYSRPDCCLCRDLEDKVRPALSAIGLDVASVNVDNSEDTKAAFGDRIPVLVHKGNVILEGRPTDEQISQAITRLK